MSYRIKVAFVAFIALLILTSIVAADESELYMAKSIGIWEDEGTYGYFKVLVYRRGLEHSRDDIVMLITEADTKNNKQKIIKKVYIQPSLIKGYVNDISLAVVNNGLLIGLDIEIKAMDGIILREVLLVSLDGNIKVIAAADYVDIYE